MISNVGKKEITI